MKDLIIKVETLMLDERAYHSKPVRFIFRY